LQAGVLDRAENLFSELTHLGTEEFAVSQINLMQIYEREKDWELAILAAQALQQKYQAHQSSNITLNSIAVRIAHYHCELAEMSLVKGNTQHAYEAIHKALATDKHCARASILLGNLEKGFKNFKGAIKAYKDVERQEINFLSEIAQPIYECYEAIGDFPALIKYLEQLLKSHPFVSIVLVYAKAIQQTQGDRAAAHYVTEYMRNHPSIRGLSHLVNFHLARAGGSTKDDLLMLKGLIDKLLLKKPVYVCRGCGLSIKKLHWQCPSCREWNTVKPIHGLEGE
jgi:lipopolysaccharide biosynthesis regulator YciM